MIEVNLEKIQKKQAYPQDGGNKATNLCFFLSVNNNKASYCTVINYLKSRWKRVRNAKHCQTLREFLKPPSSSPNQLYTP